MSPNLPVGATELAPHALWDRGLTMWKASELHAVAPAEVQRSTLTPWRDRQLRRYRCSAAHQAAPL